jgi:hypothetical protein
VNPYEVLGVDADVTDKELRRAYVALARRFHPDANPGAEERMRVINEAWALVGDRHRRAAYDRARTTAEPPPDPGFRPDDPIDDGFDPRAQPDLPYRARTKRDRQRRDLLTFAPVVLFVGAAVVAGSGFFFDAPVLIGLGVVLFSLACIAMIVVLLTAMVDARHDEG